jgi:hypothetical protein
MDAKSTKQFFATLKTQRWHKSGQQIDWQYDCG